MQVSGACRVRRDRLLVSWAGWLANGHGLGIGRLAEKAAAYEGNRRARDWTGNAGKAFRT